MEDDDEFGDLYSDIFPSSTTPLPSQLADTDASKSSQNRPIDEEILCGALQLKNSNSVIGMEQDASTLGKALTRKEAPPDRRGFDLNLDASETVDGNIPRVAWGLEKCEGSKGAADFKLNFMEVDDDLDIGVVELEEEDDEFAEKDVNFLDKLENVNGSADKNKNVIDYVVQDEWESDESEDDLQIVLESDESEDDLQIVLNDNLMLDEVDGEEALVIVADDGHMSHGLQHTEMEERDGGGEEERKESCNAAKTNGVGGTAAPTAVLPKIGYSNHVYHQLFHSQFKYVRPGAASTCGAASLTPGAGQVCPPITLSVAGRGRGDWPPAAVKGAIPMQTGFQAGYGMPVRGAKAALRNYDSGLDITLPSHKTIFEVDIDRFEEKPWRNPGMDVSDFFNFGLNEEGWKDYCKTLDLLRIATSMQGKIHVHEIGRAEQDYDPDLPQELAVVVGIRGIPSENANPGKAYPGTTDLARENGSAPLPIGRPIPVETGTGDRVPSIDTRRLRLHDSDTVIEIVCQRSADDDDTEEQQDNDSAVEDEVHDPQQDDVDRSCHSSHAYNGQKTEQLKNTVNRDEIGREESLHVVSEAAGDSQPHNFPHEERSGNGRANSGEKNHVINGQNNSSSLVIGSDGEQAAAVDYNDVSVAEDRSFDMERKDTGMGATSKQKGNADVEQVSQEYDDREDSKPSSSEDGKAKTGIKDQRKSDDKLKDEGHHPRTGSSKKSVGDEDDARRNRCGRDEIPNHSMAVREREDSRSCHMHMKSVSTDWRKESDISERSWRLRDEDFRGGGQRNWDGNSKLQNEKVDILPNKRRRDGALVHAEKEEVKYNQREGSTHRKRERDNSSDQWRIDRMHNVRQKLEPSLQRERGRQIDDDEWRRHRQLHEEKLSVMRSGRSFEDRTWNNHYQKSDDYRRFGRKYHPRDVAQHVVDDYARGYRGSNAVMRARYRKVDRNDTHVVHTFHTREEHIGYISEKVNLRSITKRGSGEDDICVNEEASADDIHAGSRRGRSNSEHWTSHKERGFGITPISSCSLNKSKDPKEVSEDPWHKLEEENMQPSLDNRKNGGEMNHTKVGDKHLDAVEKLKKHSKRFKFAMPHEEEAVAMKSESLPSSQTENRANSAVETARPARKRGWRGN